jgi:HEPN domain-containing protein
MKPATREWIKKAESDYQLAVSLTRRRKVPVRDQTCFLFQQSAEKYIKARLEEADVRIPKTHDLVSLIKLALPFEPLWSAMSPAGKRLTEYEVAIRYPGAEATVKETKTALQDAKVIRGEARLALGL